MDSFKVKTKTKKILADTITPVSIYLKLRDLYPKSILLESSDYHGSENSYSFICLNPMATYQINNKKLTIEWPEIKIEDLDINNLKEFRESFNQFINSFHIDDDTNDSTTGIFGYSSYDAVQYFETIKLKNEVKDEYKIPELNYSFYKYVIAVNHFKNELIITENLIDGEDSKIEQLILLMNSMNISFNSFEASNHEKSNLTDEEYRQMVANGKEHCYRGDVFQIVLSRQFSQTFEGDDFNVYRSLRSINPSPYLFYFDYGDYKIFGSSPEAQLKIENDRAYINPIAGTFKRTGDDEKDMELAGQLANDPKENAEHVMLVDLARNDLSRHGNEVKVENYREIQYYSHVLHMVSTVSAKLKKPEQVVDMKMSTFPAGTLSGAPKYKAMELIDRYENQNRGYYGGAIGFIDFKGNLNQAIMIRTFLSKNSTLFYQAGAGIVAKSNEESELQEVNNKLGALKKAIEMAKSI